MKKYMFDRSISEHRKIVANLKSKIIPLDLYSEDHLCFKVYKPFELSKPSPTLLYIPGNAFVASETDYTNFICSYVAHKARCQVIIIKHRLAPEFQFPHAFNDTCYIIDTLLSQEKLFGIDKSKVAIAGYSSGGNLAALITIQAKYKLPIIRQILISPVTDLSRSLHNFQAFQNQDQAISEQFVSWFFNLYAGKNLNLKDPKISPYWSQEFNIQGLPPTDLIFGEFDRFRGDSELYGEKLLQQGNVVDRWMFPKENHGLIWHNMSVINAISARLSLSFATVPIEKLFLTNNYNKVQILKLIHYRQNNQENNINNLYQPKNNAKKKLCI